MPALNIFPGVLVDDQHPEGVSGHFEAEEPDKAVYFARVKFRPVFHPDGGEPFTVGESWRFEPPRSR